MTERSSTELNNGFFASIFDESEGMSCHFSPDVDSKYMTSKSDARDSGVTSDLDRAVAALEARSSDLLERSVTSENVSTCLSFEQELEYLAVKQDASRQEGTSVPEEDNEDTKKPRDFSELRAMFSQTDTSHDMSSTRKGKLRDFNSPRKRSLDSDSIEHDKQDTGDVINEMQSEGDSVVARMKRNFETSTSSIDTSSENSPRGIYKKPVSFDVKLDDYVTRDSSNVDISHDPSKAQQIKKEVESALSENIIRTEPRSNFIASSPRVENIEQNNERIKEKEILSDTGIPSESIKNISFDISFDDKPSKRISPKTMPKPSREKLIDSKTAVLRSNVSESTKPVEHEQASDFQEERKDFSTKENRSYSFEVSFDDDSPKKTKSPGRLNKMLVKKPYEMAEGPPAEEIIVSESSCSSEACENEQNGHLQDETNSKDNELLVSSPKEQLSVESERSTSFEVAFVKDATLETNKEHVLSSGNGTSNEKGETKKSAQAISFDICFDEDSVENPKLNRKPKLTPKHIRLKKTKQQQQQQQQQNQHQQQQQQQQHNTKNKIESHIPKSGVSLSVLPKSSRTNLQEDNERNTYTLDEVSSSLQSACERGLTLEDALDDLAKQQETIEQPGSTDVNLESDEVTSTKRGTYSLDEVATCLVSAADKGLTVSEALDTLAKSEEKEKQAFQQDEEYQSSTTNTTDGSVKRGTYDLNDVSKKIDDEKDKENSLEEALIQLLGEVETVVKETQKTGSRGTYDLKEVSEAVEQASDRGIPVEKTLEKIATIDDNAKRTDRAQLTATVNERQSVPKDKSFIKESRELNSHTESFAGKRGTYTLDDVEKQLEEAADKGSSIVNTLSDISKPRLRETSISLKINGTKSAAIEETVPPTRNTYTLDEVAQSLELAKSKGIPIVEALSNISTERLAENPTLPGSRETYTLDKVAQSLETAREKGLPIVMALENLVLNGGGSLRGPAEVAVHRRQGKLTNRKTYALASPLETIGEEKQLRLFDGTSRKLLPPTKDYLKGPPPQLYDDPENTQPSGQNVVQTLDLLTSACEALLKTTGKKKESDEMEEEQTSKALVASGENSELRQQIKAESRDSGISFPGGPSERGTYSLDEVSETLEGATKKGIPVIDALGSLTTKEPVKKYRIPRALRKAGSKSESSLNRSTATNPESSRQTYSLDSVSNSVEDAKAKGIPVIAALDELTNSLARFSATRTTLGKPLRKPERPSIARKKEAARASMRSELGRDSQNSTGSSFPISYPPTMRNSYSLDDVASAFEKAYQTGIPFQDVLEGMHSGSGDTDQPGEDAAISRSTGSLKMGKDYLHSTAGSGDYSRTHSASSLTKVNEFSIPLESDSSLDGKTSSPPRKSSTSSEGSLTCSSNYGSDVSVNRDSSSTEELPHVSKVSSARKQRKRSNGPFQLKKGSRRNSPANLKQLNTSTPSLQGDSVESLASRDSDQSDSSQTKRGTYDLKKIGEELDKFKVEGVPVVQGLDKLVSSASTVGNNKNEGLQNIQFTPKRGTYSLEDVSQQLDSEKNKGDTVIHALDTLSSNSAESLGDSQPSASVSIAGAAKQGVPVVEAFDKLSHEERFGDLKKTESSKPNRAPFAKPGDNSFFVEYFPSKTEKDAPKPRIENGVSVQVTDRQTREHRDLDNYPTRDRVAKQKVNEVVLSECTTEDVVQSATVDQTQFKEETQLTSTPINTNVVLELHKSELRSSENDSQILDHSRVTDKAPLEKDSAQEDSASQTQLSSEQKLNDEDKEQVVSRPRTRPRWQRSGSYVEALESFEELLASDQELSSPEALDSIPVKESDYLNGNYDTMYPEKASSETSNTSPRGRSTWRPSGSVLDEILNLMDEHEEQGLSIADALEKAAELSEQQGGSDGSDNNARRSQAEQKTLDLNKGERHVRTELPENNGTLPSIDSSYHGNQLQGYQAESSRLITTQQDNEPRVLPPVVDTARYDEGHVLQADVTINEDEDPSSKKGFTVFIGDETVQINEGLTPEQQRKRDRFLRNRQKKLEEEKARRESENDKKRQRETRQHEIEAQKRERHFRQPEEHPRLPDTSPPKIIRSSGKSNRKMITNALSHACLSGAVNNENRERCLQMMSSSQGSHFIILLKDGLRFRGLFVYSPDNEQAYRIYGTGPKIISSNMVDCVYKYNSGNKEFIKIPSKTLSISVDGVAINKVYWQSSKPNVASKTQSNLKRPTRPFQR